MSTSPAQATARAALVAALLGHAAMAALPFLAGPAPAAQVVPLSCPTLAVRHGVGADLRTFTRARDLCASP